MTTLARLYVVLGIQSGELERGLAGAGRKLQASADQIGQMGNRLTARVTLPLAALGAVAIKAASDQGEALNALNVVFEDNTAMQAWAQNGEGPDSPC
jgi:hypothetical protein